MVKIGDIGRGGMVEIKGRTPIDRKGRHANQQRKDTSSLQTDVFLLLHRNASRQPGLIGR